VYEMIKPARYILEDAPLEEKDSSECVIFCKENKVYTSHP
jgi:hypothetical protein